MEKTFEFIDDFYTRYRLERLYEYIDVNNLWETVRNISSSYDKNLDQVYLDCEYSEDFLFSMDMSHIRTIEMFGWDDYINKKMYR